MPAYVIVDIEITDPVLYEEYKKLAPAIVAAYGGKYLTRGGKLVALEGTWSPKRLVILEFDSMARAEEWWNSPEYAPVKQRRVQSTHSNLIVIEGNAPHLSF